jgi:hypothetical protein
MVSAAVACLPTVVSLLLLAALFMQISGVSLALTWPQRLCLLGVLLCRSLCYKFSPSQVHWERWHCTHIVRPACLFTVHVGGGSSLLSCGVFLPLPLSQAFLLLVAGCAPRPCSSQSLSGLPGLFIYSPGKDSLTPIFSAQCAPPSFPCVFIVLIAYYSVSLFSPGGGQSAQGAMLLWPRIVCGSTTVPWSLTWSVSSHAIWVQATGSLGALLVSPFKVKWWFSVPAGGVEGSKLWLFSVIMPAKCVSSVSPRFHYRRLHFCFLPLGAILESPLMNL